MKNVSRASQTLHWMSTGKRKTEDYMERHNNEGHCDVGWTLPNSNGHRQVSLFVCLVFNGTFSTNRLYRAITVG